ncbi:MAG: hypothetical protein ACRDSP_25145 [Pseudonocardiaceae bacterium]
MEIVRELVGQRTSLTVVASAIAVLVLAGIVAALAGSAIAVAVIAGVGMVGTALGVLAFTAFTKARL